jgi:hypothetical protein
MLKARARGITVGLVGLLLLLAWGTAEAQLPAASAEVARVTGPVSVLARGQQNWAAATVGARLVEGDQIRALAGGSADLNLPDGSTILVAENTRFAVTKLQFDPATRDRNASFYLVAGKVRAQVSQAAVQLARQRQSNFTISTPSGVAAVRGTIAVIAHNPITGETLVFSLPSPGQAPSAARVTFINRAGQQVTLTGGNFTRQGSTGAPSPPLPISTLTGVTPASITGPGNATTAGLPDLTGFQVTIIQSDADITLVQTALGIAVVVTPPTGDLGTFMNAGFGGPRPFTGVGGTFSPTSGIGQDLLSNANQKQCPPVGSGPSNC